MSVKTLHFGVSIVSRNKTHPDNAVAACAYRSGLNLHDEKLDKSHNYGNRKGIIASEIFAPENAPQWMQDNNWSRFGNEIEKAEDGHNRRATALLAKDFQVAAPRELNDTQNWELAAKFAESFNKRGLAVGVAYHKEKASDGGDNPHFHFLVPMREINKDGFGKRYRKLDGIKSGADTEIMKLRREYYQCVNDTLKKAGINHTSYDAEKQKGVKPKAHKGKHATALEKQGVKTRVAEYNQRVDIDNFMNACSAPLQEEWEAMENGQKGDKPNRNYESLEKYRLHYQLNRGSAMAARDAAQKSQSNVATPPTNRSENATERAREGAKLAARQTQTWQERVSNRDVERGR